MAAADSDLRPANPIAPEIRAALAGLRWRIRAYVVVEGIAVAAIWLGAAFWLSLALDYLPILAGASEMPRPIRAALLVITAAGALGLFYWYVLRRVAVRLADRSMAVLLERRYREFGDSLLTAVASDDTNSTIGWMALGSFSNCSFMSVPRSMVAVK